MCLTMGLFPHTVNFPPLWGMLSLSRSLEQAQPQG